MNRHISRRELLGGLITLPEIAFAQGRVKFPDYTNNEVKEAFDFTVKNIDPILNKCLRNPNELPAIKQRIKEFARLNSQGIIDYRTMPVNFPTSPTVVAKMDFDAIKKKPVFFLFVPAVKKIQIEKQWGPKPSEFDDYMLVVYSHEMIHYENSQKNPRFSLAARHGKNDPAIAAEEEALTWGIMVKEIIRPLATQNRRPMPEALKISDELKKVNDDYTDPRWINAFKNYMHK